MQTQIITFYDTELIAVSDGDELMIPIRPICKGIGIHSDWQGDRIKNDQILGRVHGIRRVLSSNGREYDMLCLPINYIHGWLFSIELDKVKEEVRPRLLIFKEKCYAVLYEYFFGNARRMQIDAEREHFLLSENRSLNRTVRDSMKTLEKNKVEIRQIQNRRAENYRLEPIPIDVEGAPSKRKFLTDTPTLFSNQ